jgi:hypothetical protein
MRIFRNLGRKHRTTALMAVAIAGLFAAPSASADEADESTEPQPAANKMSAPVVSISAANPRQDIFNTNTSHAFGNTYLGAGIDGAAKLYVLKSSTSVRAYSQVDGHVWGRFATRRFSAYDIYVNADAGTGPVPVHGSVRQYVAGRYIGGPSVAVTPEGILIGLFNGRVSTGPITVFGVGPFDVQFEAKLDLAANLRIAASATPNAVALDVMPRAWANAWGSAGVVLGHASIASARIVGEARLVDVELPARGQVSWAVDPRKCGVASCAGALTAAADAGVAIRGPNGTMSAQVTLLGNTWKKTFFRFSSPWRQISLAHVDASWPMSGLPCGTQAAPVCPMPNPAQAAL